VLECWEGVLLKMHVAFAMATARLVWIVRVFRTGEPYWTHAVYAAVMGRHVVMNARRRFGKMSNWSAVHAKSWQAK